MYCIGPAAYDTINTSKNSPGMRQNRTFVDPGPGEYLCELVGPRAAAGCSTGHREDRRLWRTEPPFGAVVLAARAEQRLSRLGLLMTAAGPEVVSDEI